MEITFSRDSVAAMLAPLAGNTILRLKTRTAVKQTGGKGAEGQGEHFKESTFTAQVFTNQNANGYLNKRNKNRAAIGIDTPHELKPRAWGTRIAGTPFIEHKGEYYLEVIFIKVLSTKLFRNDTIVTKESIAGYPKSRPASDTDGVIIRSYKLSSLRELVAFGNEYSID